MRELLDGVRTWRIWKKGAFQGVAFNGWHLTVGDERIVVDPPPLSPSDEQELLELGKPDRILITNANHLRYALALRDLSGAPILVPTADADRIDAEVDGTFSDGDTFASGALRVVGLVDQKTPGESTLYWAERRILILGDALIGTPKGSLSMLPAKKFADVDKARAGLARLGELVVDVVLTGDGESILEGGSAAIRAFLDG